MNKDTVTTWREYLRITGWLELVGYHKAKGVNEGAKGIPIMRAKHGVIPAITRTNKGWENIAVTGVASHGKTPIPVTGTASHGTTGAASHGTTGAASHDVDIEHIKQKPNHVDGGFEKSGVFLDSARPCLRGARLGLENLTDTSKASGNRETPILAVSENVSKKPSVHRASDLARQMGITAGRSVPRHCSVTGCTESVDPAIHKEITTGRCYLHCYTEDEQWQERVSKDGVLSTRGEL